MVRSADRVAVVGMRMPLHSPAAADVTVVSPQEEVERARKRCDQRDVSERPADEVVAPMGWPVNEGVERVRQHHRTSLPASQGFISRRLAQASVIIQR